MRKKEMDAARKVLDKIRKRIDELNQERQAATVELTAKKAGMAEAVMDGGDVNELATEIERLEKRTEALAYSLVLGQKQVKAATARVTELQRQENERLADAALKDARAIYAEIGKLGLDDKQERLQAALNQVQARAGGFYRDAGLLNNINRTLAGYVRTHEAIGKNMAINARKWK